MSNCFISIMAAAILAATLSALLVTAKVQRSCEEHHILQLFDTVYTCERWHEFKGGGE